MLLYDITKYESLMGLTQWIEDVKRYAASDILMVLVGAKQDLASKKREITIEQAKKFASHYPEIVDVVETSAKESVNIETVFTTLTRALKEQHDTKRAIVRTPTFRDLQSPHKSPLCSKLCSFNDCCNWLPSHTPELSSTSWNLDNPIMLHKQPCCIECTKR